MISSEQEKHLLVFMISVSAKFEYDQIKDEEAAPILM